jgi:hypothetical protein
MKALTRWIRHLFRRRPEPMPVTPLGKALAGLTELYIGALKRGDYIAARHYGWAMHYTLIGPTMPSHLDAEEAQKVRQAARDSVTGDAMAPGTLVGLGSKH